MGIAKGSCAEVRSMLYIAKDIGYLSNQDFQELYEYTLRINKLIVLLIQSIKDAHAPKGPRTLQDSLGPFRTC